MLIRLNSVQCSQRWWDPESSSSRCAINPLRLEWIQECAGSLAGKKVLDVSCGGGGLSEAMARGVDADQCPTWRINRSGGSPALAWSQA